MTKAEQDYWRGVTADSATRWTLDEITRANRGTLLAYKGGEDGVYVEIEADGTARAGRYAGAVPHIGEALFTVVHERRFATQDEAFRRVAERLGLAFLRDLFRTTSWARAYSPWPEDRGGGAA